MPAPVRLHACDSSSQSHCLHWRIHTWVYLPVSPENRGSPLIIHQAGEGSGANLLSHDPEEIQHRPVSAQGDGGWRKDYRKSCFLIIKRSKTIEIARWEGINMQVSAQRPMKFMLFFCWGFRNCLSKCFFPPPPCLASIGITHTTAGNESLQTIP